MRPKCESGPSTSRIRIFPLLHLVLKTENLGSVRVISPKKIKDFIEQYSDSEASLLAWNTIVRASSWKNFADLRSTFKNADQVGRRTVFNIAHNRYRLISRVNYQTQTVFVFAILTHKQYDQGEWK